MFAEDEHHILVIAADDVLRQQLVAYLHSQTEAMYKIYSLQTLADYLSLEPDFAIGAAIFAGGVFAETEFLTYRSKQNNTFPIILVRDPKALKNTRALQHNSAFTQIITYDELSRELLLVTVKYLVEFNNIVHEMKNLQLVVESAEQRNHRLFQYISHELTAPLQTAKLLQENIKYFDDVDDIKNSVDTSIIALTHALDTINNISEYVRSNRKQLVIQEEDFNLIGVLEEVHDLFEMQAEHKGIDLQIDYFSYEDCNIKSDKARIRQVLINLVRNALNYTDQGSVSIWAQRGADNLCVSITDTGVGMNDDILSEILTRNTYEPSAGFDSGLGIGLMLSREILDLIGGYLSAHSVEGKGTTFTIVLPDNEAGSQSFPNMMAQAS